MRLMQAATAALVMAAAAGVMGQDVPVATTLPAGSAEVGAYTVTGVAHAGGGGVVLVKVAIMKVEGDTTTEVESRPYVQMKDGQTAEIMIGMGAGASTMPLRSGGADVQVIAPEQGVDLQAGGATVQAAQVELTRVKTDAFTGLRLQLVKATSSKEVAYMATVVEKDVVVWAGTGTFKVEAAEAGGK